MPEIRLLPTFHDHILVAADFPSLTPAELFNYFVEAELLLKWWPQVAETDPKLGGAYHLSWTGMGWHLRGIYREFVPVERLVFTWNWDHQSELPERTVDIDIQPAGKGSFLTLKHGTYGAGEAEIEDRQSHIDGWMHFLERLQAVAP